MHWNLSEMTWERGEIAYCSNVHPCSSVGDLLDIIGTDIKGVRETRGLDRLNAGLWLPNPAVSELLDDEDAFATLVEEIDSAGIRVVTTNGFPYGNFHEGIVKENVYSPDWSQPERFDYTKRLATLMSKLLPDGTDCGTLSTLPLGFQKHWSERRHRKAVESLVKFAAWLNVLEQTTGRQISLCLEMEPGCAIETTSRMVELFAVELREAAMHRGVAEDTIRRYLAVCFDVCHQAVMFEDVYDSLATLLGNGIAVGKIQLSSALTVDDPGRIDIREALSEFAEDRYLHQVRTRSGEGVVSGKMDLRDALKDPGFQTNAPWRIHFHVPVMLDHVQGSPIGTTREALSLVLDFLSDNGDFSPHLEVETYTWNVMPGTSHPRDREDLQSKLAAELAWVENQMWSRNLLRDP